MSELSLTTDELQALGRAVKLWEELLAVLSDIEAWPRGGELHIDTEIFPGHLGWIGYDEGGALAFHPNIKEPEA